MYGYTYDEQTGGILLNDTTFMLSKEPRPVYSREMDVLGFDKRWQYQKQDDFPYMWAESNAYWYRGKLVAKTHEGSLYTLPKVEYLEDENGNEVLSIGENLKPVDIKTMVEKNQPLLEVLEQFTVKKIFDVYKRYRKRLDCFHVAFSGGKDSIVLLDLVKKALPSGSFIVVFGDTSMEFPDTYDVVDKIEAECKDEGVHFYRAKSHLKPEDSWRLFGPPSRVLRWCCSIHKSTPQVLKIREVLGKSDYQGMAFVGVRADESVARSTYEYENYGKKQKGQYAFHPLLTWSSAEIWLYMYYRDLIINIAYKKGNSRVGCLLCPMSGGKSNCIRNICYPQEIQKFTDIICQTVKPEHIIDYTSYIDNGGWVSRGSGRDLNNNCSKIHEQKSGNNVIVTVDTPLSTWEQWIKTCSELPLKFMAQSTPNGYSVELPATFFNSSNAKMLKQVITKTAYCIGCRACEAICPHGSISFKNGLEITNCYQCGQCHSFRFGCYVADCLKIPSVENKMVNLNTFEEHAPKMEWVEQFFMNGNSFMEENSLGKNQQGKFKRFLNNANLIDNKGKTTQFFTLLQKIEWESSSSWGLILITLIYGNPQIRWYITNMPIGDTFTKKDLELKLQEQSRPSAIVSAFARLCDIPLGTTLNFGSYSKNGNHIETLTRTKCTLSDSRVVLYALYKFAEACDGYYQFSLSRLLDFSIESKGVSPAQIFGFDRDEMEGILNGLSVAYPEFINVTFTHDLDKISLREDKKSEDVLSLF